MDYIIGLMNFGCTNYPAFDVMMLILTSLKSVVFIPAVFQSRDSNPVFGQSGRTCDLHNIQTNLA
jgi:hypothetical protein